MFYWNGFYTVRVTGIQELYQTNYVQRSRGNFKF